MHNQPADMVKPIGAAPRLLRGPFTRWPRLADAALALLVFVGALVNVSAQDADGAGRTTIDLVTGLPPAGVFALAIGSAALYWRRRYSLTVLGVNLLVSIVWVSVGYGGEPVFGILVALYGVGRYVGDGRPSYGAVGITLAFAGLGQFIDGESPTTIGFALLITFLPWYVGRRIRIRGEYLVLLQERAEYLERERAAEALRAVAEERARIARDLHDVVAHRVSMMTVQAGAARMVAADDPGAAQHAMGAVEQAGRQALGELRHLLNVLRPQSEAGELGPQPCLAELPRLIDQLGRAGVEVALITGDGVPADLPARVDLSAYRIVQEALTNVLKHGGPGVRAEVHLDTDGQVLTIEVADTGSGGATLPGSGHGIVGMRERALLLGGTLEARPRPGGGFRVTARLPVGEEAS